MSRSVPCTGADVQFLDDILFGGIAAVLDCLFPSVRVQVFRYQRVYIRGEGLDFVT